MERMLTEAASRYMQSFREFNMPGTEAELFSMALQAAQRDADRVSITASAPFQPSAPPASPAYPRKPEVSISTTHDYLPAAAIKALRSQFQPLAEEFIPPPQDLRAFWARVATAIKSLDPSFAQFEGQFDAQHVQNFGPHVLGFVGWQQVSHKMPRTWHDLRREADICFGLTKEQMEEQFFSLKKEAGESAAAFIVRVDLERRKLDVSRLAAYHTFIHALDDELRRCLDMVRLNRKANSYNSTPFGWEDVVMVCKDRLMSTPFSAPQTAPSAPP
jgi:hypothetical protein